jgi:hypothetical protein
MKGVARATVRPRAMATGARPAYEEVAQIAAIGFVHLHGSTGIRCHTGCPANNNKGGQVVER